MSGPVASILLLFVVHVIGFVVLIAMMGPEMTALFRSPKRYEEGDDDGRWPEPEPADPGPADGGLPLPDAQQAPVRLREPGRLRDHRPRRPRRPAHAPSPAPAPAPDRS